LHVANDGPALSDVTVEVRFGDTAAATSAEELLRLDSRELPAAIVAEGFRQTVSVTRLGAVDGWAPSHFGLVEVTAPDVPGSHDLVLRLLDGGQPVSENRYPIHVVAPAPRAETGSGPMVVDEDTLDAATGEEARVRLARGEAVVILAQPAEAASYYPVPVELEALTSVWGSTVFRFTTDHGAIPALPRRAVLVAEDSTVQSASVLSRIGDQLFPDTPVVIAYKPVPGAMTGTVLGSHAVGPGRLVFCQYRLTDRAASGDATAGAVLADVLRWASAPHPVMRRDEQVKDDGRRLVAYSWTDEVGQ